MARLRHLAAAIVALMLSIAPAEANDSPMKQFGSDAAVQIDSSTAYLTYRTRMKAQLHFIRAVTPDDRAIYEKKRSIAFGRVHRSYETDLAEWQDKDAIWRNMAKAHKLNGALEPIRPVEPSEADFAYPAAEFGNLVSVGTGPQFDKGANTFTYLVAVQPGTYTLYGAFLGGNGAAIGTCLCMGSVKFEAAAGKVTDMGELRLPDEPAVVKSGAEYPKVEANKAGNLPPVLIPSSPGLKPAGRLAGLPIVAADLHAADKIPNFFGILIDRLPSIPGILAYDRDAIIDLKAAGRGQ